MTRGRSRVCPCGRWVLFALALVLALGIHPPVWAADPGLAMFQAGADPLPRIKALRAAGRLTEALEAATAAVQADPTRRDLRLERGFLLAALGRYDDALAEYDAVLDDNPADMEALLEHAQVKVLQGRFDEAEGEFRFTLALAPGLPGALFGLGDVLTWKRDYPGARVAYLGYVGARPEDALGQLRLGDLAILTGDREEARARYGEALRLDPRNAAARAGLARVDRLPARFRLEVGYVHETLTRGEPDWRQAAVLFVFRPRRGTELNGGAQHFHRFGEGDQLVSVGFAQAFFGVFTLSGQFSQGLRERILPSQLYEGQLAVQPAPRILLFASYTFADFTGNATAGTVSPGARLALPGRVSLLGRYFRTESTGNEPSNALLVQLEHETTERFQPYVGYARGGLGAGALTSDEFRSANSQFQSAFAGFSWRIVPRFGIKADYAYQTVKNVYVKHTFGLTTFIEF